MEIAFPGMKFQSPNQPGGNGGVGRAQAEVASYRESASRHTERELATLRQSQTAEKWAAAVTRSKQREVPTQLQGFIHTVFSTDRWIRSDVSVCLKDACLEIHLLLSFHNQVMCSEGAVGVFLHPAVEVHASAATRQSAKIVFMLTTGGKAYPSISEVYRQLVYVAQTERLWFSKLHVGVRGSRVVPYSSVFPGGFVQRLEQAGRTHLAHIPE